MDGSELVGSAMCKLFVELCVNCFCTIVSAFRKFNVMGPNESL